ncbi:MAG: filamentous hemagglutinin N-terminal domain-containing protein [Selenomonadaceae bacterium]|nr:filamentous hemagglutinin N-terminal domain-containing protein [Selenomonadaceae bacterium]
MNVKGTRKRNLGALALAIALALGGSPDVQAMPQGGTVASGAISGLSGSTVSSGGTLTANSNSIINWDSFSIGKGESLTLNTSNYAMLNRVTGTSLSELLGTLNQTGEHMALLVNPNGITVGGSGVINAQYLVLSTLALSDSDFQSIANGGTGTFATPSGRSIGAPVTFQSGATVTATDVYTGGYTTPLAFYGGTIDVADGVTFTVSGHTPGMDFVAANSFLDGGSQTSTTMTATPANTLSFRGSVDCTNTTNESYLNMFGGAIHLDGANLSLSRHDKTSYSSEVDLVAANHFGNSYNSDAVSFDRAAGNVVTLKDTKISADGIYIVAGSASKNSGTTLDIGDDGTNLITGIGTSTFSDGDKGTGSWSAWSESASGGSSDTPVADVVANTASDVLTDATVQATKSAETVADAGTGVSLFSDTEDVPVQMSDGTGSASAASGTAGAPSATSGAAGAAGRSGAPDDRTMPALSATVLSAVEQGNAQFESFVHQNIHDGYSAMEGVLNAATSPAQRMEGASTLVSRIDSDKTLDEGAKLAQAYGMIQAVDDNATMSEEEKKALRQMIAKNFRSLSSSVKTYLASVASSAAKRNA